MRLNCALLVAAAASLLLLSLVSESRGECCRKKQIGSCCGVGDCNVFCCNCDDGCDKKCDTDWGELISVSLGVAGFGLKALSALTAVIGRRKRSTIDAADYFSKIDADADGFIDLEEAVKENT
jgi:hypothetical protein